MLKDDTMKYAVWGVAILVVLYMIAAVTVKCGSLWPISNTKYCIFSTHAVTSSAPVIK